MSGKDNKPELEQEPLLIILFSKCVQWLYFLSKIPTKLLTGIMSLKCHTNNFYISPSILKVSQVYLPVKSEKRTQGKFEGF